MKQTIRLKYFSHVSALSLAVLFTTQADAAPMGDPHPITAQADPQQLIVTDEILDRIAYNESTNNPLADNPNSTALGEFQFLEQVFLEQLYKLGALIGLGHLGDQILQESVRGKNGAITFRYSVTDKTQEAEILSLRTDRQLARSLARVFLEDGIADLKERLQNPDLHMTDGMIYMVHHFGVAGTHGILRTLQKAPNTPFHRVIGNAVCADNMAICYKPGRRARTVQEVADLLEQKMANAPVGIQSAAPVLNTPRP